ncbi:tetratricopeptide repeat protein [Candidatus Sumerlaeota bacterium]|nr:tetratricopeptide repeat protein [Candidatus Sumerlaeota bacterium]
MKKLVILLIITIGISGCTINIPLGEKTESDVLLIAQERARHNPHALFMLGTQFLRNDKLEKAAKCFRLAVKAKSDFVEAYIGLGHSYRRLHKFRKAEKAYNKALEIEPQNTQARLGLARLYLAWGKFPLVRETLVSLPEDQQHSYETQSLIAYSFYLEGNYEEALRAIQAALRQHPKEGDATIQQIQNDLKQFLQKYSSKD